MGLIEIYYNGKSSKDFNIFATGAGASTSPARKYDTVEIAGRNGSIYRDKKSYSNVSVAYKCVILGDMEDFERFRAFMNSQIGYNRLEDSERPYEYRMAVAEPINPNVQGDDAVTFELSFDCMPQRFLKDGEKTFHIVESGSLINNYYESKPMLRAYADGSITINDATLTLTNVDGYVDIDCELMDAYKGNINMNSNVSGTFPTLKNGLNTITGTVDIIPRWWTL